MLIENFRVESPNVVYTEDSITSTYAYNTTTVDRAEDGKWVVRPIATEYQFRVNRKVPKLG